MPLQIIRDDITKVKADAIVNTANPKPRYSTGTDGAMGEAMYGVPEWLKEEYRKRVDLDMRAVLRAFDAAASDK